MAKLVDAKKEADLVNEKWSVELEVTKKELVQCRDDLRRKVLAEKTASDKITAESSMIFNKIHPFQWIFRGFMTK